MYTKQQKAQMTVNGKPDAERDNSAAIQTMTAELAALVAQMEAEAERHLQQVANIAAALSELGGLE